MSSLDRSLRVVADDPIREKAARDYFGKDYIKPARSLDQSMVGPNIAFRGGWVAAMAEVQRRGVEDLAALDYAESALSETWAVLRRIAAGEANPAQVAADLLEAHGHEDIRRALDVDPARCPICGNSPDVCLCEDDEPSRPPVDRCGECGASTWDPGLLRHSPGCTTGEDE